MTKLMKGIWVEDVDIQTQWSVVRDCMLRPVMRCLEELAENSLIGLLLHRVPSDH